ncbi:MAG: hypothetical protein AB7V28_00805, partial [Arcobacteraceae bacterium]
AKFLGDINILPQSIVQHFGITLQEEQSAIIRLNKTFVTYHPTAIKLHIKQVSYCGDYYELVLNFSEHDTFFIKANVSSDFNFSDNSTIYLDICASDILVVNT